MEKVIDKKNIRDFAYVNDGCCVLPVKGVVIDFFGLGNTSMFGADTVEGGFYGERGILYVVPYYNPWSWMNKQAVGFTDEIIDVLFDKYGLSKDTPIVASGESMGGQGALVYCVYSKRTPVACVVNCPVCDVAYHYTERPDLPRTMYSAIWQNEGSLDAALKSISPRHLIDRLPAIDYHIFHCAADSAVIISRHSDVFVRELSDRGLSVSYDVVPGRDHCDLGYSMKKKYAQYIVDAVESNARKD